MKLCFVKINCPLPEYKRQVGPKLVEEDLVSAGVCCPVYVTFNNSIILHFNILQSSELTASRCGS